MRALSIILWLLLSSVGVASASDHIPVRFQSGPFLAPIEVIDTGQGYVQDFCTAHAIADPDNADPMILGCAIFVKGDQFGWHLRDGADSCRIVVFAPEYFPTGYMGLTYEGALEHEKAHCRGWPPDHPSDAELSARGLE